MSESRQTHVTLHDIDPQALDQLVQFAYTAEIVVGEGNVQVRPPHPSRPTPLQASCFSCPHVPVSSCPSPVSQFLTPTSLAFCPNLPHRPCSQLPASCS